jgi:uracil-DNA glycosylase
MADPPPSRPVAAEPPDDAAPGPPAPSGGRRGGRALGRGAPAGSAVPDAEAGGAAQAGSAAGGASATGGLADGPVPPGTGWPEDPATAQTPIAHDRGQVAELAASGGSLGELAARQSVCRACPRLVEWREEVARTRRRSFQAERYWGRPVPGWGDEHPRILILGLAPAAHGGNRTGRIFTGDRSGDFLFAALWRSGLASQPTSVRAGDGQRLAGARMSAAVRCAPPANKPEPAERDTCAPWLTAELTVAAADLRVILCLGGFAWQAVWPQLAATGWAAPRPRPAFGHGARVTVPRSAPGGAPLVVLGCYHPSQQNTFTGRVTGAMLDEVLGQAAAAAGLPGAAPAPDPDLR